MSEKFQKAFKEVLDYEGGYSDHKSDRGGKTKFGITKETAEKHGYKGEMKDLSLEKAKEIYKNSYWEYDDLPVEIGIELFDQAVNFGSYTANKHLQMIINVLIEDEITVDGVFGPNTKSAALKCKSDLLLKGLNVLQGARYIKIALNDPSQKVFIEGWFKRIEINKVG